MAPNYGLEAQLYNEIMTQFNERTRVAIVDAQLKAAGIAGLNSIVTADLMQQVAQQTTDGSSKIIQLISALFTNAIQDSRRGRLTAAYTKAAQEALSSIDNAYMRRPYKTRSSAGGIPYRNEWRYSGGALRRALNSPQMFRASSDGIFFINKVFLDTEARQWYRLNFGAGGRGNASPKGRGVPIRIFGQKFPGDFGLERYGPSDGFSVPPGHWSSSFPGNTPVQWASDRRGQDFFILGPSVGPVKGQRSGQRYATNVYRRQPTPSLGIQGSRFLDVGVRRLAVTFPTAVEKVVLEWMTEAKRGAGPVAMAGASSRLSGQARTYVSSVNKVRAQNVRNVRFYQNL